MAHKRKRSESELSSPSSAFSISPNRPTNFSFAPLSPLSPSPRGPFSLAVNHSWNPPHLSSRTMKRFRNNRPSEDEVHKHTLDLLYGAQQRPEPSIEYPMTPSPADSPSDSLPTAPDPRQSSLHRFWKLQPPVSTAASAPPPMTHHLSPSNQHPDVAAYEDCGSDAHSISTTGTAHSDSMDIDEYSMLEANA